MCYAVKEYHGKTFTVVEQGTSSFQTIRMLKVNLLKSVQLWVSLKRKGFVNIGNKQVIKIVEPDNEMTVYVLGQGYMSYGDYLEKFA